MSERESKPIEASPFHHGEQAVQEKLGVRDIEDWARKVVLDHLTEQHSTFYTSQPFLVVSARDTQGRSWVTLLDGPDGFVSSPDPRHLVINASPSSGDALEGAFEVNADVGILGIELATRRRNRVNGRVVANGVQCSFELDQTTWRRKWDELLAQNYVVLEDALVSGLVKTDDIPRQYLQG